MHLAQSRLDRAQKMGQLAEHSLCSRSPVSQDTALSGRSLCNRTTVHKAACSELDDCQLDDDENDRVWHNIATAPCAPGAHYTTAACKLFSWLPGTRVKQAWQILAASKHITRLVPLYTLTLLRPCPSLLALDISNISVVSTSAQDLCKQVPSLAFLLQTAIAVMISSAHAGLGLAEGALQKQRFQWSRGLIGKPLRSALRPSTRPLRCSKPGTVCCRAVYAPFHVHHSVWRTCLTIGS